MIISHVELKNWRNFQRASADLRERMFLVGPNAAGKSNFLDAFKFLRDLTQPGGGLQKAILDRGGVPQIRNLSARKESDIGITVELKNSVSDSFVWKYSIGIKLQARGEREPYLVHERVWRDGEADPFAQSLVGNRKRGRFGNAGVAMRQILDAGRVNVVAATNNQVLLATDDLQTVLRVEDAEVSAHEPARLVE